LILLYWPVHTTYNLATFMCWLSLNLVATTSWNPQGLSKSVERLLCLHYCTINDDHLQKLATFYSTLISSYKFIWVLCLQEWNNLMYFLVYYVAMAYLHKAVWKSLQD